MLFADLVCRPNGHAVFRGQNPKACTTTMGYGHTCPPANPSYFCPTNSKGATDCTEYAYVSDPALQPYWDIAEKYGFANYMFQTSQGPSFPAHQFLLSGSSAPDAWGIPFYTYFAAENPSYKINDINPSDDAGCAALMKQVVPLVSPTQDESTLEYPCYEHPTLTDLLDQNKPLPITWRYYSDQANSIWTAPNGINHICNNSTQNGGGYCGSSKTGSQDWNNNVGPYLETKNNLAPFLNDLQHCNLAQVTWVVPDGRWSDHPSENIGLGPDYVANIVNAVGGTGPPTNNCGFWNNTVILIVWDDWGGWYDHVNPVPTIGNRSLGYANGTGQQYVYGFRVPLLVVSTFAKQHYISGPKSSPIYYDFGSILRFIEETFLPAQTFINPTYPYADQFVTFGKNDLTDFFGCFTQACQNPFQPIPLVNNSTLCNQTACGSAQNQCNAACFINYIGQHEDPDTY